MGKDPHNILRLVKRNDQYAAADALAKYLQYESIKSGWYEHDLQRSAGGQPIIPHKEDETATSWVTKQIPTEMRMGNDALKLLRKAKIKEQFEQDTLRYEAELNAKGLALVKHRD